MNDPGSDFLAGLLEFAELPESKSNTPPPPTDNGLRCGFCLAVKYKNQSSLDSHIKDCAQWRSFTAKFWREAGWTRAGMETGFTFEDEYPVVAIDRICQYCQKVFANPKEVKKHLSANRCINTQAIQDASPAMITRQWMCAFCPKPKCFTSETSLDNHIKLCAPRNEYKAAFWKEAGWTPDSRYGKGLDFHDDGGATAKAERICQACYQCCKSLVGLTRHLEHGQCPGEPDEMGWKPPPSPSPELVHHLKRNCIDMPVYRSVSSLLRTKEHRAPRTTSAASARASISARPQKEASPAVPRPSSDAGHQKLSSPSLVRQTSDSKTPTYSVPAEISDNRASLAASQPPNGARPQKVTSHAVPPPTSGEQPVVLVSPSQSENKDPVTNEDAQAIRSMFKPAESGAQSSEIGFLLEVINTAPSPAITELLINIARGDQESRAIPSAPVRHRQKRSRESENAAALADRAKAARDRGIL